MRFRYYRLSLLFFLTAVPLTDFATPVVPWDDMRVKHTWDAVPVHWESLGHPAAGATIDLYIALEPNQESALIDTLSEVSDPRHLRHVHPPLVPLFTSAAAPFQIWCIPFEGTGCGACQTVLKRARTRKCLACAPRHTIFLHLNDTLRLLVDDNQRARVQAQPTPWRLIPTLPEFQGERDDNPHYRLRAPRGAAHTHSSCRADDALRLRADYAADSTQGTGGVREARDGAGDTRHLCHAVVPTIVVRDGGICARRDRPEHARDCGHVG
jgi:hypothetical protein